MATVKTQDGKVVLKDGKVSCECCGDPSIGCPTSNCTPTAGNASNPAVCLVPYAAALLYKQGGTWLFEVSASLDASFDLTFLDQRYRTIVSGSGSLTLQTTNQCNISGTMTPVSLADSGGLFRLSTDEQLVPAANATLSGQFSLLIRETATSPRSFCVTINFIRSLVATYHNLNNGTFTFGTCSLSIPTTITHKAPFNSGGTNPQGSGTYQATLTFTASAP